MATVLTKFSYSEGEYGHSVRVFARPGRNNLSIEYWDQKLGKMVVRSLGHSNPERARQQCRDLSDAIRLGRFIDTVPGMASETIRDAEPQDEAHALPLTEPLTGNPENAADPARSPKNEAAGTFIGWKGLFRQHYEKRGQHKKGTGPSEDRRRQKVWIAFFWRHDITCPAQLDNDDLLEFVRERVGGLLRVPFVELKDVVHSQTAWADLVYLVSVLNWATEAKDPRAPERKLLPSNTLKVPKGLKNKNPHRPRANHDDVLAIRRVANSVDSQKLFRDFERLHDELGWRVTGRCRISAADVSLTPEPDMPFGYVKKNAAVDKENVGDKVPLSRRGAAILRRVLRSRGINEGGQEWLFPGPGDPTKPWSRWHVRDMTERAEAAAKIAHIGGAHAGRRKWASERKGHPLPDIMKAGGWKDARSLEAYLQDDTKTTYEVVSQPTRRIRRPSSVRVAATQAGAT